MTCRDPDRAEESCRTADVELKLFGQHGAEFGGPSEGVELGFVDLVVATQEGDDGAEWAIFRPFAAQ